MKYVGLFHLEYGMDGISECIYILGTLWLNTLIPRLSIGDSASLIYAVFGWSYISAPI